MDLVNSVDVQSRRARLAAWTMVCCAALAAAALASGVAQHLLLQRAATSGISDAEAQANDLRHQAIAGLQALSVLAGALVWLRWQHRAYANLRLLGTGETNETPGWSVGYWFVPVLNLWRPYQLTKELWLRSRDANSLGNVSGEASPALLGVWWAAWVGSGLVGRASVSAMQRAKTLGELQSVTELGIGGDVLSLAAAVAAAMIVRRIDAHQRAAAAVASAAEVFS